VNASYSIVNIKINNIMVLMNIMVFMVYNNLLFRKTVTKQLTCYFYEYCEVCFYIKKESASFLWEMKASNV